MRVVLQGPNGDKRYEIFVPKDSPQLLGEWLKALFSEFRYGSPGPVPLTFTLKVW